MALSGLTDDKTICSLDLTRLAAGRLWAASRMPYFATALFALRVVAASALGTFAVDPSWRLFADPEAVDRWSVEEIGGVLLHEVMHLLRDHAARGENQDVSDWTAEAWNAACDAEINDDLVAAGVPLPGSPVLPSTLGLADGLLAEDYYQPNRRGRRSDCGSGAHGRRRSFEEDALGDDEEAAGEGVGALEAAGIRLEAASAVLAASRTAPGSVPGGLRRWATGQLAPAVCWRRELAVVVRRAVSDAAGRVDYRQGRRNRRAAALPSVVLPGLVQPVPSVAVVVDTSASVHAAQLAAALAEIDGVAAAAGARGRRVTVLAVDTKVQAVTRVSSSRNVELAGGGGTDMRRGIEAAAALRPRAEVLVVLTDGWSPWPERPPARTSVIVGLVGSGAAGVATVPAWARSVIIPGGRR